MHACCESQPQIETRGEIRLLDTRSATTPTVRATRAIIVNIVARKYKGNDMAPFYRFYRLQLGLKQNSFILIITISFIADLASS